jgi:hypothetical protein
VLVEKKSAIIGEYLSSGSPSLLQGGNWYLLVSPCTIYIWSFIRFLVNIPGINTNLRNFNKEGIISGCYRCRGGYFWTLRDIIDLITSQSIVIQALVGILDRLTLLQHISHSKRRNGYGRRKKHFHFREHDIHSHTKSLRRTMIALVVSLFIRHIPNKHTLQCTQIKLCTWRWINATLLKTLNANVKLEGILT